MSDDPVVYCVVPVHNRLEITKQFLMYLCAQDYESVHIIIVDDGSIDGTGEFLAKCEFSNLTVLAGDGSLWWGGAMHMGIDYVTKKARKSDYLLMLNNDVRIESDFVSTLVNESVLHQNVIVGSSQRDELTGELIGGGFLVDYLSMRIQPVDVCPEGETVDAVTGRGALFPMLAVLDAGNINFKALPHYLADLEYSARVSELGWSVIVSGKVAVYTSSESSDKDIRNRGILMDVFSFSSKNNIVRRLFFFSLRGPLFLRFCAVPRYALVGLWRLCSRGC